MIVLPNTPLTGLFYVRIGIWEVISPNRAVAIREGLNLFFTGAFEGPRSLAQRTKAIRYSEVHIATVVEQRSEVIILREGREYTHYYG